MYKLKQAALFAGAMLISALTFLLTLPLLIFVSTALVIAGVGTAIWLRFQMNKVEKMQTSQQPANGVIIEGHCRTTEFS